ncbi:MAG: (d)CMP kinase [Alphaproteobacteria bacterium]|nr:(d)CMP kinase [Alphaproteobacteria bacterium]
MAIAIDGPAGSGKGTVARGVAHALGYRYVDTGAIYRAVALEARRRGVSWDDGPALAALAGALHLDFVWDDDVLRVVVDGQDVSRAIRDDEIGTGASTVSRHPAVRDALLALQRSLGARGAVVMDGRDIGTVVLPDAALKVYLDADLDERARRRHEELLRRGENVHLAEVVAAMTARDRQDMERATAPLRQADDAVRVDTTALTVPVVVARVLTLARERGA